MPTRLMSVNTNIRPMATAIPTPERVFVAGLYQLAAHEAVDMY